MEEDMRRGASKSSPWMTFVTCSANKKRRTFEGAAQGRAFGLA